MPVTNTTDTKQPQSQSRAAVYEQGNHGKSMPSVPVLQHKEEGQATDLQVTQLKRKRNDEEAPAQLKSQSSAVQRVVDMGIPNHTRIIIDDKDASDFGDKGTIIRNSRNVDNCKVVEFDNEPGEFYRGVSPRNERDSAGGICRQSGYHHEYKSFRSRATDCGF